MSLKMKLTSTICAFFLVLGITIMGVLATPNATVNLGGTITFQATNVYAKVTGSVSGASNEVVLDDITINDKTVDGDISTWSSQDLAFQKDGSAITIDVTIENLATDRNLYAYITDTKPNVANVKKSMKQGEAVYENAQLVTLDTTTTKTTISLSMEIDNKNQSLEAGTLYGYNIVLMDISGIPSYDNIEGLTLTCNTTTKTASVKGNTVTSGNGDVVIPRFVKSGDVICEVTNIGSAFYNCQNLTSVTIPVSVTSIDSYAFFGCSNLTKVNVSDVDKFASISFSSNANPLSYAKNLYLNDELVTDLNLNVESISFNAFYNATCLKSVTLGENVKSIDSYAFSGCSGLERIIVSEDNSVYDSRNNCNALIETASNTLIQGCNTTVIPDGILSIKYEAFLGCESLTDITIPRSVTSIGYSAFKGCTGLTGVIIPDSVTSIDSSVFYNCTGLTNITIPNSVTSIGLEAFYGCSGLTSVTIPDSVTIMASAFNNCTGLTSVTIGDGVTSIGDFAFGGCTSLTTMTVKATTPPTLSGSLPTSITKIYVPIGSKASYVAAAKWSSFAESVYEETTF